MRRYGLGAGRQRMSYRLTDEKITTEMRIEDGTRLLAYAE